MSDKENSGFDSGNWFLTVLFLIFLILKLCGVINWSWWWVTAPLWGGLALALAIIFILLSIAGILKLIKMRNANFKG